MPKGPRKFKFIFGAAGLTRWGGLVLFRQFCNSIGLRRFLQTYVRWPVYSHRIYHPSDIFLAHLFAIVAGIERIANTQSLIHNGLIPAILGLPEFLHQDTLRTFLWRFNKRNLQSLQQAHDKLRNELFHRFGLLYSAIIEKLPSTMASSRIRTRLDAPFYSKEIVQSLDEKNIEYAIAARMHKPLKSRILSARYHEFTKGWEAAEFTFPVSSFKKEHRFIAIRRAIYGYLFT